MNNIKSFNDYHSVNENAGSIVATQIDKLDKFMTQECKDKDLLGEYELAVGELFGELEVGTWAEAIKADENKVQDILDTFGNKAQEHGFNFSEGLVAESKHVGLNYEKYIPVDQFIAELEELKEKYKGKKIEIRVDGDCIIQGVPDAFNGKSLPF